MQMCLSTDAAETLMILCHELAELDSISLTATSFRPVLRSRLSPFTIGGRLLAFSGDQCSVLSGAYASHGSNDESQIKN